MKVLFYSSVSQLSFFKTQSFYVNDITVLKSLGHEVVVTNSILSFLCFWKYDVSFLYFFRKSIFPAIISKFFMKDVFFTGGIDLLDKEMATKNQYQLQKVLFNLCYFFSSVCFIVSNSDMNNIHQSLIFKKSKLRLSFHSIDIIRNQITEKKNDFITICWMNTIGNVKRKGIDRSLRVFNELIKIEKYHDSKFHIIGFEGEGSDYLKNLIKQMSLVDNVVFHGVVTEERKIKLLSETKYLFQMSLYEGFGVAALEGLINNCYIIHSNRGGLKDTVGKLGLIVDLNDNDSKISDYIVKNVNDQYIMCDLDLLKKKFSHSVRINTLRENGL